MTDAERRGHCVGKTGTTTQLITCDGDWGGWLVYVGEWCTRDPAGKALARGSIKRCTLEGRELARRVHNHTERQMGQTEKRPFDPYPLVTAERVARRLTES